MVIGTGQNGTWILAESASSAVPAKASRPSRSTFWLCSGVHKASIKVVG